MVIELEENVAENDLATCVFLQAHELLGILTALRRFSLGIG
jgi:hypothetical protein